MAKTSSEQQRRMSRRIGAAFVLVFLLTAIPGYLSSRPQFFSRYSELQGKYSTWASSTHVGAACKDCHTRPDVLSQSTYRVRMLGEFYLSLASRKPPKVFGAPSNAACIGCHNELRAVSARGDLQIPHRAHVNLLKMECIDCHNFAVHEKSPEGGNTPPMAGCLECHDGTTAKDACSACHTDKALPRSHRAADWVIAHPEKVESEDCASCHAWIDAWCADCHNRRPRSHGQDWRSSHRDRIEVHRSCEACHEGDFCVRCHGEVPQLNFTPDLKRVQ